MTGSGVVVDRRVRARPSAVYAYLTTSDLWVRWQGTSAWLDAVPGGAFEMHVMNGAVAQGRFVELVRDTRVVFTWGWVGSPTLPPGSSTVEIDLIPDGEETIVRLRHHGLPPEDVPAHRLGWHHYLPRLATASEGADPGPDPGPSP
ncbi:MAG TPA: SRPBCC family protein [Candidatus Limnocylindrales bacterium]|jgi:uncharacterized protein YndB with AHSA1/START domain